MEGIANGFYRFSEWIMRFAYVNLLWIGFTLLGLIFLGFMPATAAMFGVIREWVRGNDDIPVFQTFWRIYREEFLKVNILGVILFLIGYILSIEYQILRSQTETIYYVASFGVIVQFILYAIVLVYILPIFVHFKLKLMQYFKWSFIIGLMHPIINVVLVVAVLLLNIITYYTIPGLLLFFGGSVSAFILMWGASLTFSKFEKAEANG